MGKLYKKFEVQNLQDGGEIEEIKIKGNGGGGVVGSAQGKEIGKRVWYSRRIVGRWVW